MLLLQLVVEDIEPELAGFKGWRLFDIDLAVAGNRYHVARVRAKSETDAADRLAQRLSVLLVGGNVLKDESDEGVVW
ncbi:MAG: hypothetical protein C5B54_04265 [Acidobacteria bacterium]|nr:MAG: hypothetical protein C5B54_04265 [Acidobacteriota bacterium]